MVLGIGFLLLVLPLVSAVVTGITEFVGTPFGGTEFVAELDLLVSFAFITVLFAMIYIF
jgi:hypothetical protein